MLRSDVSIECAQRRLSSGYQWVHDGIDSEVLIQSELLKLPPKTAFARTTKVMLTNRRSSTLSFSTSTLCLSFWISRQPLTSVTRPKRTITTRNSTTRRLLLMSASVTPADDGDVDLLIIGAGDLGLLAGGEWLKRHPGARIVGQTATERTHERLRQAGIKPMKYTDSSTSAPIRPKYILFAIPPVLKIVPDYDRILEHSLKIPCKRFVFVSSTGVHNMASDNPTVINEQSPIGDTQRAKMLRGYEEVVESSLAPSSSTGCQSEVVIMRFSGLYSLRRGGHAMWASNPTPRVSERRTANMLHRYDAAKAIMQAFDMPCGADDNVFIIASKETVSAKQMCDAMKVHPEYKGNPSLPTEFADENEIRDCDSSVSRERLNWKATWESFVDFMHEDAKRAEQGLPSHRLID